MYKVKLYTKQDGTEDYEVVSESKFVDPYKTEAEGNRSRKTTGERFHYRPECNKDPEYKESKITNLDKVKEWIKENPKEAKAIGIGTAGLAAIGTGLAIYKHHKNKKKKSEENKKD